MHKILIAATSHEYQQAANLFRQYANSLPIDLTFQQFEKELKQLPAMYGPPYGAMVLCKYQDGLIACTGLRKINKDVAELKRMYVLPEFQRQGIAKALLNYSCDVAEKLRYKFIRLDTLAGMIPAINLYRQSGFYDIPPYYANPHPAALYFEKKLSR